jgi:ParB family transcriptional regulator, chromosome partitioning protein
MTEKNNESTDSDAPRKRPLGLGRGLNALLGDALGEVAVGRATPSSSAAGSMNEADRDVRRIALSAIRPLPGQPRRHFDDVAINELADSIRARGLLQPILVRAAPDGTGYQLVAGERRWRAAQRAGLHEIPALVRSFDDSTTYEIALVENIQREDLTAIEEAIGYRRLIADYGHSAEALTRLVGKSRSHIANLLRLLELPDAVQAMISDGSLAMGHARALIGHPAAERLARQVVDEGLSVRAVEALVRGDRPAATRKPKASGSRAHDADLAAVERHLAELLGVAINIAYQGGGVGALTLRFATLDQLDMICQRLSGESI